ncbi:hypothetical protein EGM88_09875 [Aureibaculum marinum]|uniref:Tetratricopeptide repeat protein n=1 Tax=Aureibaculum marinum TaxID=2487930 RepID=A0A3N4NYI5_9FLAO|nr:hypothetical protein [Aureibaculum marinum]RPD96659.1 hypothetical protein EGM88_09875 [Aureibaculum marinum]
MERKVTKLILSLLLVVGLGNVYAQDDKYGAEPDKCKQNLSLFHESVKAGNYDGAYDMWKWCYDNCPKASLYIYVDGLKIAENMYEKGADKAAAGKLIDEIYTKRLQNFPKNSAKVYSDWAISLQERGASNDAVFEKLEAAFKENPAEMSIKNLALYFKEVTERNKDTDPQKVFDTYDDVLDGVNAKMDRLTVELDKLNEKDSLGQQLTSREKIKQKNNAINLRGLSQVEPILDQTLGEVATCERLIPLYNKSFEANKNDAKWLKRAVSRMYHKECTEDDLYPKMVEAWVHAEPSANAYVFYAGILEDRGESAKALEYKNKAIDLETDPFKKAKLLLGIASQYRYSNKSLARSFAYKAIKERPSYGDAYLFIAGLYGSSANSCGTNEFEKRMVYVAAANMAAKAKSVDPGIATKAKRSMNGYLKHVPSTKLIFNEGKKSGTPYKIGCWINTTVRIP